MRKCGWGATDFISSLTLAFQVNVQTEMACVEYSCWMGIRLKQRAWPLFPEAGRIRSKERVGFPVGV